MSNATITLQHEHSRVTSMLSDKITKIVNSAASRGFSELPGPSLGEMEQAGLDAMEEFEGAAMRLVPSLQRDDVQQFTAAFGNALGPIAATASSWSKSNSPRLAANRTVLIARLEAALR